MTTCYHCDLLLSNKNRTGEHVIPNAIGGRLISYKLLCRTCNIALGETIDAELGSQFEALTATLNIRKHRKNRPGDRRDRNEADEAPAGMFLDENFEADPARVSPGLLMAIAKIAINVFLHFGGERKYIVSLNGVLKGNSQANKYVHWHPSHSDNKDGEVHHSVRIRGHVMEHTLYAHVVLFSSYWFIVKFDDDYRGTELEYDYKACLSRS